ncbi:MAG: hypothetical protein ACTS44_01160 [Candidatus Hodgkinia cicadicola]
MRLRRTSFEGLKSFGTEVNDLDGAQLCSLIANAQSCFGNGWKVGCLGGLEGEVQWYKPREVDNFRLEEFEGYVIGLTEMPHLRQTNPPKWAQSEVMIWHSFGRRIALRT